MRSVCLACRVAATSSLNIKEINCKRNTRHFKYYTATMDSSMDSKRYAPENEPELSPLEQEVLDEYAKLVGNLDNVHHLAIPHEPVDQHTDTLL
jgi:hypothetical protein